VIQPVQQLVRRLVIMYSNVLFDQYQHFILARCLIGCSYKALTRKIFLFVRIEQAECCSICLVHVWESCNLHSRRIHCTLSWHKTLVSSLLLLLCSVVVGIIQAVKWSDHQSSPQVSAGEWCNKQRVACSTVWCTLS